MAPKEPSAPSISRGKSPRLKPSKTLEQEEEATAGRKKAGKDKTFIPVFR
jgi:hypothetical protein